MNVLDSPVNKFITRRMIKNPYNANIRNLAIGRTLDEDLTPVIGIK